MTDTLVRDDAPTSSLFAGYAPPEGCHDEMLSGADGVRSHGERFLRALGKDGRERFARGASLAERHVRENGIAYGPPGAEHRPWQLDPLPMLLSAADWATLADGLKQRWQVLDLVARDVYGEQKLLKQGLPPELVFRDPQFLRASVNVSGRDDRILHVYAADLARSPDGRWWIVADRTNAASGLGFALENRIVSARVFPDLLEACHVERHAPFFIALKRTLAGLAPTGTDEPNIVLLTDDSHVANFFEDSFLSRYLGYTLARFDDLTVRDGRVSLKTLEGLLPVDVMLRRPSGIDCDPLELESASAARGIPGLAHAVRRGKVGVVNSLGSGLFESPAWMAFLPSLCKTLLGEELRLPSVATWWCGHEKECKYVLERLDKLTILPAFRQRGRDSAELRELNRLPKEELAARIRAHPTAYCGQEIVSRSSTPIWTGSAVEPAYAALRTFLAATDEGPVVLPGGLARVSRRNEPLFVSLQRGERSKDAWVVSDRPVRRVSLLPTSDPARVVSRHVEPIPSRVAENFFWLGRNLARTESSARSLRTAINRLTDEGVDDHRRETPMLLRLLAEQGQIDPSYAIAEMRDRLPALEEHLTVNAFATEEPGSVRSRLAAFVGSASAVRDRISTDGWRILRQADLRFRAWGRTGLPELSDQLDLLLVNLIAFGGLVTEGMTRNASRLLLDVGLRLERSLQIATSIQVLLDESAPTSEQLDALLEMSDSRMTYRQRFLGPPRTGPVLDLLVRAADNPRSSWSQLNRLRTAVDDLPSEIDPGRLRFVRESIGSLFDSLAETTPAEFSSGTEPARKFLARVKKVLPAAARELGHAYFAHAVPIYQPIEARPR